LEPYIDDNDDCINWDGFEFQSDNQRKDSNQCSSKQLFEQDTEAYSNRRGGSGKSLVGESEPAETFWAIVHQWTRTSYIRICGLEGLGTRRQPE